MKNDQEASEICIEGEHNVALPRQQLWESMNNPEILQRCIKGCDRVEKVSDDEFSAIFKLRIGPLKKTFRAQLNIQEAQPPEQYQLVSTMDAGIAGQVHGIADVQLGELSDHNTRLCYQARVTVSGWLGELGVKVLGEAAQRYMQRFFDNIIDVLEERG